MLSGESSTNYTNKMDQENSVKESFIKKPNMHFGIELKTNYTVANLLSIPLVMCAFTIISTFVNTKIIFLFRDPAYFNVPVN